MEIKKVLLTVLSIIFSFVSNGQLSEKKLTISGKVSDSNLNPVKGAMIFIDSRKTSAVTGKTGKYSIKADRGSKEILALSPEKGAGKSDINGRSKIDLILDPSVTFKPDSLPKGEEDEMVEVGYGTMKKRNITSGKATVVRPRFSSYSNIYDLIKAEVPGVQVRGSSVYIQGISTFGGNAEAVFIVDGIITEQVNDVAPADVMSIQLLKGPSTAVYGIRGANGVILIKTFRGTEKK